MKPEYPERTTDHGQATGKLYHLRLQVECTFFCNLQSRMRTHVVLVIGLYELLGNPTTLLSVMTSTFTLSWRFKRWNQIRTAPVSFLNNWILLQGKENVITKMYCFQPEIIDIAVPTIKGNISSSDFWRSVYIISTSYHNLWPMNLLE
jgi:hypothetical protein